MILETEESRPGDPWEALPIEFLIKVLRDHGLPVSTLATCRSVCKKWMEIVDGPDLRSKIWNEHVLVYYDTKGTAYFCCSGQWITRNITFESKRLVAADGGLLCFNNRLSTEYVLYNPVPDKFLTLNVPHEIDGTPAVIDGMMECVVVGLVVDRSTKQFKLLLGGVLLPDERRSLIYDSTTGTWSWLSHPFPAEVKRRWKVRRSVACGGRLFWLVWERTSPDQALVIFDLREEKWEAFLEKGEDVDESVEILPAMDTFPLADWVLDRHRYSGAFLSHPMVRAMDGALINSPRERWDGKEGRPFPNCAAGVCDGDSFNEEFDDPVMGKYWARFDMLVYMPLMTRSNSFWSILPQDVYDPMCAMIPTPGVSARKEWIAQPRREPQEVVEVPIGEELHEGPGNEDAVDLRVQLENDIRALILEIGSDSD